MGTVYEMMKRDGNASEYTEALISKLDKNQDGKISQAEAVNACIAEEGFRDLLNLSINKHFHY